MLVRHGTHHGWTKHVTLDLRFQNATFTWKTTDAVHHTNFLIIQ